jgi:hypothetical protein
MATQLGLDDLWSAVQNGLEPQLGPDHVFPAGRSSRR